MQPSPRATVIATRPRVGGVLHVASPASGRPTISLRHPSAAARAPQETRGTAHPPAEDALRRQLTNPSAARLQARPEPMPRDLLDLGLL